MARERCCMHEFLVNLMDANCEVPKLRHLVAVPAVIKRSIFENG